MSARQPLQAEALVDRGGLITRAWSLFLSALTKLPSARLSGAKTYNPPDLASGATTTTTVTVSGAMLGWQADASFSLDLQGIMMTAYVSAADTATVVLYNPTAGAINLASGTLTAFAWQP